MILVFFLGLFICLAELQRSFANFAFVQNEIHLLQGVAQAESEIIRCAEIKVFEKNLQKAARFLQRKLPTQNERIKAKLAIAERLLQARNEPCRNSLVFLSYKIWIDIYRPENPNLDDDWPNWQLRWQMEEE